MNITSDIALNYNKGLTERLSGIVAGKIIETIFDPENKTMSISYLFLDASGEIITSGVREINEAQINTVLAAVEGSIPPDLDPIEILQYRYYLMLRYQMKQTFEPLNSGLSVNNITVNP